MSAAQALQARQQVGAAGVARRTPEPRVDDEDGYHGVCGTRMPG